MDAILHNDAVKKLNAALATAWAALRDELSRRWKLEDSTELPPLAQRFGVQHEGVATQEQAVDAMLELRALLVEQYGGKAGTLLVRRTPVATVADNTTLILARFGFRESA